MQTARKIRPHVRHLIKNDCSAVLKIEAASYLDPWTAQDFDRCLRQRNCIAMVAEIGEAVVAYMIYELGKNSIHLLTLAVSPEWRCRGVGAAMLDRLKEKIPPHRQQRITLDVRETNLGAQLFLQRCGFEAIRVDRGFFEDTGEDAFRFVWRV